MNPLDLSKEQKQRLVLGAIAFVALAVLIVFGIKVSLTSISEARLELHELTGKIETAEKAVSKSQKSAAEFSSTIEKLRAHLANIPPDRNYYSWATEIIYREARSIDFEIDAIDEIRGAAPVKTPKAQDSVALESYALRITAHGGYENVKGFLERMGANHPLIRVTGIEISTGAQPDVHDVQLFIEWPFNMGYISETWKGVPAASTDPQPTQSTEPDAVPKTGKSGTKKQPTPPPSRIQETAPVSGGTMESYPPAVNEMSSADSHDKSRPEELLKQ